MMADKSSQLAGAYICPSEMHIMKMKASEQSENMIVFHSCC